MHSPCCKHSCHCCFYSSDKAIRQFILHLDETKALGKKFVLEVLDELHLFVSEDVMKTLQEKVDELMEKNSYSEFSQEKESRVRLGM